MIHESLRSFYFKYVILQHFNPSSVAHAPPPSFHTSTRPLFQNLQNVAKGKNKYSL